MVEVRFTKNIQRHVACPSEHIDGQTVRAILDVYFARHPDARSYVLDEQHTLRKHMNVFVDGVPIRDRDTLTDAVRDDSVVDVMQALSGG